MVPSFPPDKQLFCLHVFAVLENVVFDEHTRDVDFSDKSVTGKYKNAKLNHIGNEILDGFVLMFCKTTHISYEYGQHKT